MYEYSSVLLVEILDCLRFWIEFHGAGNGRGEFLVWEIDTCELRIEGAGTERADKRVVRVVLIE